MKQAISQKSYRSSVDKPNFAVITFLKSSRVRQRGGPKIEEPTKYPKI
jgi:hypothetical protein